jgi:TRAP-type transport system small permease protein
MKDNFFNKLDQFSITLNKICMFFASIAFLLGFIVIVLQVIFRYTPFLRSLSWPEELARFLTIYMAMLGIIVVSYLDAHPRIDIIRDILPPKFSRFLLVIELIISVIFVIFLFDRGMYLFFNNLASRTPALKVPWAYAYFAIPLGCMLLGLQMILLIIKNLYINIKGKNNNINDSFEDRMKKEVSTDR